MIFEWFNVDMNMPVPTTDYRVPCASTIVLSNRLSIVRRLHDVTRMNGTSLKRVFTRRVMQHNGYNHKPPHLTCLCGTFQPEEME